jgi:hypothetical protein
VQAVVILVRAAVAVLSVAGMVGVYLVTAKKGKGARG